MGSARSVALTGADQTVAAAGPGLYCGYTLRETAGAAAVVQIFDSSGANSGTLLDTIALTANSSQTEEYQGPRWYSNGIRVHIVSGTVEGSVFVG